MIFVCASPRVFYLKFLQCFFFLIEQESKKKDGKETLYNENGETGYEKDCVRNEYEVDFFMNKEIIY